MKKVEMKEWFENKLADELKLPRLYQLDFFCGIKQTEKAVYAVFYTGYNSTGTKAYHRAHWIPKSAIVNVEDVEYIADYDEAIKAFEMAYNM